MPNHNAPLTVLPAPAVEPDTPILIVTGGDALQSRRADESSRAVAQAVRQLGRTPVVLPAGRDLAGQLALRAGAEVFPVTLDCRQSDGALQEVCEVLGLICHGASADAIRIAADRVHTATVLRRAGVRMPTSRVVSRAANDTVGVGAVLPRLVEALGGTVVTKPRLDQGGLGVRVVEGGDAIAAAIIGALNYDDAVVVEQFVVGLELSVLVSGDAEAPWVVGIAEVHDAIVDRRSAPWARRCAPAVLPDAIAAEASRVAECAFRAVGARDFALVDMVIEADGRATVFEVDCALDWTPGSRLDAALVAGGLDPRAFLRIILGDGGRGRRAA